MTYNILGGRHRDALRAVVRAVAPDVVVVNESPQTPVLWWFACRALARDWGLAYVAGGRDAGRNMICVGRDVGVRRAVARRIRQRPFAPIRGVVAAQLDVEGRPVGVVGCHLSLTAQGRMRELDVVLRTADALDGPVVVAGDLNEEPGSPAWRRLLAAGFVDPGGESAPPTYPAAAPVTRIDALVVRGDGVELRGYGGPEVPVGVLRRASDHLPVVVDLA